MGFISDDELDRFTKKLRNENKKLQAQIDKLTADMKRIHKLSYQSDDYNDAHLLCNKITNIAGKYIKE